MLPGHRERLRRVGDAFAQVKQKAALLLLEPCQEALGILRINVVDAPLGFWQIKVVGLFDIANDAAVVALNAGVARELHALAGGDAAEQALALDIANQRSQQREPTLSVGVEPQHRHRPADERTVVLVVGPLAAMLEAFRHRRPERKRVVAEMVVQLDQPREDGSARLHHGDAGEPCRGWFRAILNGDDRTFLDIHDGLFSNRERVVHRDDAPGEGERWAGQRIDRAFLLTRRCERCAGADDCAG